MERIRGTVSFGIGERHSLDFLVSAGPVVLAAMAAVSAVTIVYVVWRR